MKLKARTLTLTVDKDVRRIHVAAQGRSEGVVVSFPSFEMMWQTITPHRLELLRCLVGKSAWPIKDIADSVKRDIEVVRNDIEALVEAGLLKSQQEGIVLGYDHLHVDVRMGNISAIASAVTAPNREVVAARGRIIERAACILGSRERAERWMFEPVMALDDKRPEDLIQTLEGIDMVDTHLGRMDYGVYT